MSGPHKRREKNAFRLRIFRATRLCSGLVIGLTARFIGGAELLFLLPDHFAAAVRPLISLFAGFPSPASHVIPPFFSAGTNGVAGLAARPRSIKDANQGA